MFLSLYPFFSLIIIKFSVFMRLNGCWICTEIQKSEATCKKFLGEAPVHPCKEKACKEVCKEHYYHSCKGECEMHGYEEHCHCYGKY